MVVDVRGTFYPPNTPNQTKRTSLPKSAQKTGQDGLVPDLLALQNTLVFNFDVFFYVNL